MLFTENDSYIAVECLKFFGHFSKSLISKEKKMGEIKEEEGESHKEIMGEKGNKRGSGRETGRGIYFSF